MQRTRITRDNDKIKWINEQTIERYASIFCIDIKNSLNDFLTLNCLVFVPKIVSILKKTALITVQIVVFSNINPNEW